MRKKKDLQLPYEIMLEELFYSDIGSQVLGRVLGPQEWENVSGIPLRYRLIGLAFMKKQSLDELNDVLMEHNCRPLYARNSFECTLIYAFSNGLSYNEWKKLLLVCEKVRTDYVREDNSSTNYFSNNKITFGELEKYVMRFSEVSEKELVTKNVTYIMNEKIQELSNDYQSFFQFYGSIINEFSEVHEKSRYYFCKFLYYNLKNKINNYITNVGNSVPTQDDLIGLLPLKAESVLRRRKLEPEAVMDILKECPISPGALFDEFNYYFFGYVSTDWVELFLDNISSIDELSKEQINMVATAIRQCAPVKERKKLENMDDESVVMDRINVLENSGEKKASRKGETTIRKYIRGELDLDRTTLICFLLYFSSSDDSRKTIGITLERLDDILDECGFSMLRKKNAFDRFVINYITSKEPVDFLMSEMDRYVSVGKNFYLYEMYTQSRSESAVIRKMMLKNLI